MLQNSLACKFNKSILKNQHTAIHHYQLWIANAIYQLLKWSSVSIIVFELFVHSNAAQLIICKSLQGHRRKLGWKSGGPYPCIPFALPFFLSPSPPLKRVSGGNRTSAILWCFLCCRWVFEHFWATKGWFLVEGFVVKIFENSCDGHISSLPSPSILSPSLPRNSPSPTINTTWYCEDYRTE